MFLPNDTSYKKKIADKNFEPKSPAVCTSPTAIASIAQFVSSANQALIQKTLEHYAQDLKPALKALGVSGFNSLQELQKKVQNAKDSLEEKALANSDAADDLQNAKNAFLIAEIGQKEWDTYDSLILKINELEMQLDVATSAATKNKLREDIVSTQKALSPYEERTTALQKWIAVT